MYCTIPSQSPSITALSLDALESYRRLHQHAGSLGSLSASFAAEAGNVSDRYLAALALGTEEAWRAFACAADTLVRHAESLEPIVDLDAQARVAHGFFAQIAHENSDLLTDAAAVA